MPNGDHRLRIQCRHVSKRYRSHRTAITAVYRVNCAVRDEEFVCLLGPSGCGKSTLLHLVAGFLQPTEGEVSIDGARVTGPGTDRGIVFQRHSLFPWKTVWENVAVGLRMRGCSKQELQGPVRHFLAMTGLSEFSDYYPRALSVGMQQRVGLARAFANDPDILLMDEPFGSLDAQTRLQMQELLLSIWSEHRKTVLFVTHDIEEAILLADRILLLSPRPATIQQEIPIDLPRPRTHETLTDLRCIRLKQQITATLFHHPGTRSRGGVPGGELIRLTSDLDAGPAIPS